LPGILIGGNATTLWHTLVLSVNAEEVKMFTAPVEGSLENFMELSDAGFGRDQEAPPDQGTDIPKRYSKLVKFRHSSSLPDMPANRTPPGFFRSPGFWNIAAMIHIP
jgi:hypothetical protein